ncbi:CaiB/BaiF CoA transferase family protein [Candidatus Frankia alpina]|uniref:CoA transferase n=1 Tax=Candidatus Frankia alpina TaxID=2699483 RepID=A0A4S5EPS1_9ACTN|nr:CaiB/BaiF CoA-transferase family protein [Candidatus Frankia alpina]THJ74082.1 CoA transferase [Candidatus Frankia alpina]
MPDTSTPSPTAAHGPLHGVRVIELAGIVPAPFAATLLTELGADVIRVDKPASVGSQPDWLTRGRRSVALDLKNPDDHAGLLELLDAAHVFIEGYRPGVTERLGLGPDALLARNPALVYGRMTGWGQDGPWSRSAGYDINYVAIPGALGAIGREDGPPQVPLNLVGDFGGGALYLVVGILAALHEARDSGKGQVVDCAIVDGVASLSAMMWSMISRKEWGEPRGTNLLDTGRPWYDVYETADGGWFSVGAIEPQFYARLVELLGLPEWADAQNDASRWPQLRVALATAFASRTRAQWEQVFDGTDACAAPVLSWSEARAHPHLAAREVFVDLGEEVAPAPAPRFSRTPGRVAGMGPAVGSSTLAQVRETWGLATAD